MKKLVLASGLVLGHLASAQAGITLTQISTTFNSPIGIDYHAPSDSVIISANYPNGLPHNLERINFDGTHTGFSALAGLTDELKVAATRPGNAGFASGTIFTGNGVNGQIVKVAPDGSSFSNPWVTLPGGDGLMRGSLFVDRSGVYGGDLIVATTGGQIWRVNSAGTPTFIADVNTHLEGLLTVPNDAAKYGPIAGKIIAGAENTGGLMYVFDDTGFLTTYNVGVNIEDIDMIDKNENFFGVNFGTGRILGAPASEFTSMVGDILLTQEFGGVSGLFDLKWNGVSLVADPITLNPGSATPGQWEHVTFAPAGIVEIPPVPDAGSTLGLAAISATMLSLFGRRPRA